MDTISPTGLSRRRFLRLSGATALSGLLAACASNLAPPAQPAAKSTQPAGNTAQPAANTAQPAQSGTASSISLLGQAGSGEERVLKDAAVEFKSKNSVDVRINPQPWETLMEKIQADIRSGTPTYDIFWSDLEFAYT